MIYDKYKTKLIYLLVGIFLPLHLYSQKAECIELWYEFKSKYPDFPLTFEEKPINSPRDFTCSEKFKSDLSGLIEKLDNTPPMTPEETDHLQYALDSINKLYCTELSIDTKDWNNFKYLRDDNWSALINLFEKQAKANHAVQVYFDSISYESWKLTKYIDEELGMKIKNAKTCAEKKRLAAPYPNIKVHCHERSD